MENSNLSTSKSNNPAPADFKDAGLSPCLLLIEFPTWSFIFHYRKFK